MKAVNRRFTQIINGNKQFIVPVFQRDYSWTIEQCHQMWDDILRIGGEEEETHFFGSFVYVEETQGAAFSSWAVIDGQQRLTTLSILLIALRDHIRESQWVGSSEDSPTSEQIDAAFLKNIIEKDNRIYRLALRRKDNETFRALVDGKCAHQIENHSELILGAYDYFRNLLKDPGVGLDKVYRGIGRLDIVDVTLEQRVDNPQLVFETMNSTGVDLTESDLIRNYLLMPLSEVEQNRLYGEYWNKIEILFRKAGSANADVFLRDWISLKQRLTVQPRSDQIYREFKRHWPELIANESLDVILKDLLRFAGYYTSFLRPSLMSNPILEDAMSSVRALGIAQATLVIRLYDCYDKGKLSEKDFARALNLIESYLLRRAVMGLQTRNYWSVFISIAHEIRDEKPLQALQVALARQHQSFPLDEAFMKKIQECDLYSLRVCRHVLERIENDGYGTKSPTQEYSIEHIMPQGIKDVQEWQRMLGEKWEEHHSIYLHRLGNLTFVGYKDNSVYSNKPFNEKKIVPGGFNQSAVRLNEYIRGQTQWTVKEILERGQLLANRAGTIWPYHGANKNDVREAEVRELFNRAKSRNSDSLDMADSVRLILKDTLKSIREQEEIIEVIENRSVCCYSSSGSFFAELLPLSSYVRLFVPLDFSELESPDGWEDTTTYKFLIHVVHRDCGVFMDLWGEQDISAAMLSVRKALKMTED